MPTLATSISADIRHANDEFEAAFERSDAAAIASLYAPNGLLLPTGMDVIQGTAGIQAFWQGAMEMGIKRVKLNSQDLEELTDTAIELGHYTLFGPNDQTLDQGKYLVVWKEHEGQWKLYQDIWNSSMPAQ
jgi:uncharacterized protein (TIGR02246 family)